MATITAMIKCQYQSKPKANSLNPVQAVNKNKVKKNTESFKSEKSYHFNFEPKPSIHSNKPILYHLLLIGDGRI